MPSIIIRWVHYLCPVCFLAFKEQDRPERVGTLRSHMKSKCPRCEVSMTDNDILKTTEDAI